MKLVVVHPCIGRRKGQKYIRSWQMEPLPAARLAGLTPTDIEVQFFDDRMEAIPYDIEADLVAISVETYTARRAYEIASEFRRRGVPVVMGGFHATLCPDEVAQYSEHVITGEADEAWPLFLDDFRHGKANKFYHGEAGGSLNGAVYDRSVYAGKRYLPIGLVETARGCRFKCDFCAIQVFFERTHIRRPVTQVMDDIRQLGAEKKILFFVDDNFVSDINTARDFLLEMSRFKVRWITQMSIDAAHNEEFLHLMRRAGCEGVLIGFESLDKQTLRGMNKAFATMKGGYDGAMANLKRAGIRVYGTFIFGHDNDSPDSFDAAVDFARTHKFYIAAFNHITPFPSTPLYNRLVEEGRMTMPNWWIDPDYRYNTMPYEPKGMSAEEIHINCIRARKKFYSPTSIIQRGFSRTNMRSGVLARQFFPINAMHRFEITVRDNFPLGDESWQGTLLKAQ